LADKLQAYTKIYRMQYIALLQEHYFSFIVVDIHL